MATININQENRVGIARAREVVEHLAKYYESKYPGLRCTWRGDAVEFAMSDVRGSIKVSESMVVMDMSLSGLATIAAHAIEATARTYFKQYL